MRGNKEYDFHDDHLLLEKPGRKASGGLISKIILILAGIAFVLSLTMLVRIGIQYYTARKEYTDAKSDFVLSASGEKEESSEKATYIDFEGLQEVNSDVKGWIDFVNEPEIINYPVMQGSDNDFYLAHSYTKAASSSASIFMDYKNSSDLSDLNTVLYGHNMKDRSMFAQLRNYVHSGCQDYYNENNKIYYYVPGNNGTNIRYTYTIYSTYTINVFKDEAAYDLMKKDETDVYGDWLEEMRSRSVIEADPQIQFEPDGNACPTLTLSTCTNADDAGRIIVQAVMTDKVVIDKDNNII